MVRTRQTAPVSRASAATYRRRRAAALLVLLGLLAVPAIALTRGGEERAGRPAPARAATRPARSRPRTDVVSVAARADVPVLCYHQIRPITAADSAQDRTYIVPPRTLDAQLSALERAGFTSVSADAVAAHMERGARLPRRPVLITFDDGSAGQWSRALPLLRKHHLRATFFVMTVVLGKPGWLTREEVRGLDRAGMQIGVHTWDHHAVPGYVTDADWQTQLTEPKAELERIVGHPLDAFAYPFGLWNAAAFPRLSAAGIKVAFQLADKLDPGTPMLTARRVLVGPDVRGSQLLRMVREDF